MAQHAQAVCQATTDAYWWGYLNRKRASLAVGCNVAQVCQLRPRLVCGPAPCEVCMAPVGSASLLAGTAAAGT